MAEENAGSQPAMVEWFDDRNFAEDVGLLFEAFGNNRMVGRIWGLLIISPEDALSSSDLAERLGASAGSISTGTRQLADMGLVVKTRRPGDRRTYFAVREGGISNMINARLTMVTHARRLADRALAEFADRPAALPRLREWKEVYSFWEKAIPRMIRVWEEAQTDRDDT